VLCSLDPGQGIGQKERLSPFCCTVDCGLRPLQGRELGKFSSRPAQYTCICEPDTPYLMTVSSTCGELPLSLLRTMTHAPARISLTKHAGKTSAAIALFPCRRGVLRPLSTLDLHCKICTSHHLLALSLSCEYCISLSLPL